MKKTLYNLPKIDCAAAVVITEGEKDADRVNKLELVDFAWRRIVATTSGGSDSWQDEFADLLVGTRYRYPEIPLHGTMSPSTNDPRFVVVMPDSDAAGLKYKEQIIDSLKKRSIPHCVVTFEGFKDVSEYLEAGHTGEDLAQRIQDERTKTDGPRGVTQLRLRTVPAEDISI